MNARNLVLGWTAFALQPWLWNDSGHASPPRQRAHTLQAQGDLVKLQYLTFLPEDYDSDAEPRPLILFLHGASQRGSDVEAVKRTGLPHILERQGPFLVVAPQCPRGLRWTSARVEQALLALLDEVAAIYRVDADRVYVTGLSLGGFGAWGLAMRDPKRFAAVAPICGGANPGRACELSDTSVWIFHGAKDRGVRPERAKAMYQALKACGVDVQFTLYPDAGHDAWTDTYQNPDLYTWFLAHRRRG